MRLYAIYPNSATLSSIIQQILINNLFKIYAFNLFCCMVASSDGEYNTIVLTSEAVIDQIKSLDLEQFIY